MNTLSTQTQRQQLLTTARRIMEKGPKVYQPSKYWQMVGKKASDQFLADGFEKLKIRQGLDYFQFLVFEWSYWQFQFVWQNSSWKSRLEAALPTLFSPRFPEFPMEERQRWLFVYYHCLLWDFVKKKDWLGLLRLPEPLFGSPLLISWRGRQITQDLLNSILEVYSILEALIPTGKKPKTILEVGGGYGRVMYVMKHIFPQSKIIMVDIPPGIVLAQWYLSQVFPKRKILGISDFKKFDEIKEQFAAADFIFLLPHQIELLPDKSVDLFININSFQEMHLPQIKQYFKQISRLTTTLFYTKQWKEQHNQIDKLKINEWQYPVEKSWNEVYHRDAAVQTKFFEAAYRIE